MTHLRTLFMVQELKKKKLKKMFRDVLFKDNLVYFHTFSTAIFATCQTIK